MSLHVMHAKNERKAYQHETSWRMDCAYPVMRIQADKDATDPYLVRNVIPSNDATKLYQHTGAIEPDQPVIKNARTTYAKMQSTNVKYS